MGLFGGCHVIRECIRALAYYLGEGTGTYHSTLRRRGNQDEKEEMDEGVRWAWVSNPIENGI